MAQQPWPQLCHRKKGFWYVFDRVLRPQGAEKCLNIILTYLHYICSILVLVQLQSLAVGIFWVLQHAEFWLAWSIPHRSWTRHEACSNPWEQNTSWPLDLQKACDQTKDTPHEAVWIWWSTSKYDLIWSVCPVPTGLGYTAFLITNFSQLTTCDTSEYRVTHAEWHMHAHTHTHMTWHDVYI